MSAVVNQTLHLQQISDSGACAAYFLEMQRSNRALALPSSALCSRLSAGQVGWSSGASRLPAIPWRRKGKGDSGTWEDRLKGKTLINHGIVALALLQFLSKLLAYRISSRPAVGANRKEPLTHVDSSKPSLEQSPKHEVTDQQC